MENNTKKKTKKINQLDLKECENIIKRLNGQIENKYYQEVILRRNNLLK